ncbi:hypothetical protein TNCV_2549701 [Trichonephila clavipes]|nr:hypothetical protein TNCV_2549701 [Trichonephila clavipes]
MESDKTQKTIDPYEVQYQEGRGKQVLPRKSQAVQDVIWRGLLSLALGEKSKMLPASTKGKTLYGATFQSRECNLRGSATLK